MVRDELHRVIDGLARGMGQQVSFSVDHAPLHTGADYAVNVAFSLAKVLGLSPKEVAENVAEKLMEEKLPFVARATPTDQGFVNVYLTDAFFESVVARAGSEGDMWGNTMPREGLRILVEHTQPNPFKPFHIGHLMSNTIGESIARLLRASGAKVTAVNYQGDVGLHIAKALWGLMQIGHDATDVQKIGEAYVLGNSAYEDDEKARAEIVAINKRVYAKDPDLMPLYQKGREITLAHFEELYTKLGSTFAHYFFESEVAEQGLALVREGLAKGIFEESEGAIVFRGEKAGLHTRVFITKEGIPTYEAKDLGLALAKSAFMPFDLSITTTAAEQGEYFKVVFEALAELRPETRGKFMRITHGMMQLASGKMSSRKGNIITGESLIEDMTEAARERMKEGETEGVASPVAVAVAAIKYSILKQGTGKNIVFDPNKSLSLEGDSGPYLQYAHVRTESIMRKAAEMGISPSSVRVRGEVSLPERLLARFPEVVLRAAEEYEPHHVAQYVTALASAFNAWYAGEKVLDGTDAAPYKLAVVDAVRQTLRNGLYLLGIEAPERM